MMMILVDDFPTADMHSKNSCHDDDDDEYSWGVGADGADGADVVDGDDFDDGDDGDDGDSVDNGDGDYDSVDDNVNDIAWHL